MGTVTNDGVPSVRLRYDSDATTLIGGAGSVVPSFDLRNDAPPGLYTASSTVSAVEFGIEGAGHFARFADVAGGNASRGRHVRLALDGVRRRRAS